MLRAIERKKRQSRWGWGETRRWNLAQRSRVECNLFTAHLTWQAAPRCLLFDIRLVLVRLVDVTGHGKKKWTLSQKSMPGCVCLPGMLELSGKDQKKRGEDGERWHRAWIDMQINNTMCRQTISLSMGCHLLHCAHPPSTTAHKHTCTHTFCTQKVFEWQPLVILEPAFLLYMHHEFFKCLSFFVCVSFASVGFNGWGSRWSMWECECKLSAHFYSFLNMGYCFYFQGNMFCSWCHATRTHREGCISASKLFMSLWYCTPKFDIDINKSFKSVWD